MRNNIIDHWKLVAIAALFGIYCGRMFGQKYTAIKGKFFQYNRENHFPKDILIASF
jgi:hypothetical protein